LGFSNHFPFEAETHLLPCRFLERRTGIPDIDNAPRQRVLWPRETGKSAIGTVSHAIQLACANPEIAILVAAIKAGLAEDFLKAIKYHFEANDLLRALFPEVLPLDYRLTEWSKSRATLKRESGRPEPTFDTIGVGGSIVGKHYDIIFCDDLIGKDVADSIRSSSGSVLEDTNFWISTLNPQLSQYKPFPWIRFLATRWWTGDSYEVEGKMNSPLRNLMYGEEKRKYRIKARLPSGKTISRQVWRAGDLACMEIAGIEQGKPTFPKIWPQERMDKMREENPELFACFVMNDPSDAAVRTFDDAWIHYYDYLDPRLITYRTDDGSHHRILLDNLAKVMCVDPAFSTERGSSRAAIVVTGTDRETNKHLVLEAKAQQAQPRDLATDVLNIAERLKVSRIYIEAAGQQLGFIQYVQSESLRRNHPCLIDTVRPGGRAKDLRIEGLAAYFGNGQIYIGRGQHDLLEEYRQFKAGAVYKDLLDALAYCSEKWTVARPKPGYGPQTSEQGRQAYLRARGLA
jgi:hypothetical protein